MHFGYCRFWHFLECQCSDKGKYKDFKFCNCLLDLDKKLDYEFKTKGYNIKYRPEKYIKKVLVSFDFPAYYRYRSDSFLQKKYWHYPIQHFKNRLHSMYPYLDNSCLEKVFMWNMTFLRSKTISGKLKLVCLTLLKRPRVIFKKVFANIVLKSLLNDIYKPGSKRFQKCQERFLENSSLIVRDELKT